MSKSPETSLGFVIHDVARLMRWHFDRQAHDLGLTRAQWSVLAHLRRKDGVTQTTLAQLMDIKPITLARHIDRLEQDGWVRRVDDPTDRRAKQVYLTERATPQLEALQRLGQKVRRQALVGISAEDEEKLVSVLVRIRQNLSSGGTS